MSFQVNEHVLIMIRIIIVTSFKFDCLHAVHLLLECLTIANVTPYKATGHM